MKKATLDDMELGNMIFGNSRGLYHVEPREDYQNAFCDFLFANGFDGYGYKDGNKSREFENSTFIIRPYYWGDDEEVAALPNFVYKPTGLEINWYKYPMRDAYSNQDVSVDRLKEILTDCAASLSEPVRGERANFVGEPCGEGIVWTDMRTGDQALERYE